MRHRPPPTASCRDDPPCSTWARKRMGRACRLRTSRVLKHALGVPPRHGRGRLDYWQCVRKGQARPKCCSAIVALVGSGPYSPVYSDSITGMKEMKGVAPLSRGRPKPGRVRRNRRTVSHAGLQLMLLTWQPASSLEGTRRSAGRPTVGTGTCHAHLALQKPSGWYSE